MDEEIVSWYEKSGEKATELLETLESMLEQGRVSPSSPEGKYGLKETREEIVRALDKGEITVVDIPEIYELFIKLANWLKEGVICREDIEQCSNSIYRNIYRLVRSERIMCDKIVGVSGYYEGKKKKADN